MCSLSFCSVLAHLAVVAAQPSQKLRLGACSQEQVLVQMAVKAKENLQRSADVGANPAEAEPITGMPGVGIVDRSFLGKGYDAMETDLWTFENVYPTEFYKLDVPVDCFRERMCPRAEAMETSFFESVEEFSKSFFASFGIDLSGKFMGIEGSLSASMQKSMAQEGSKAQAILEVRMYKRGGCYQMRDECAYDAKYINPAVLEVLHGLPVGSDHANAMQQWEESFIRRFGTHVALGSEHGAQVRATATSSSNTQGMQHYLKNALKAEISLDWGDVGGSLGMDYEKEDETMKELETASVSTRCASIGGDPAAKSPCISQQGTASNSSVVERELQAFFTPLNLSTGHSAFSMYLKAMSDVLIHMGYRNYSHALRKANDYHMCRTPQFEWALEGEEHVCRCSVKCQNGGTLDAQSCTCQCPSDDYHGWTGIDCSEAWGSCQMGPNSGNQGAARECSIDNTCASPLWKAHCHSTEVCCLTHFDGKCCPFGNSCDCDVNSCECVPPPEV